MNKTGRFLLAVAILTLDTIMFVIPVIAIFFVYVILARPPWFQEWISKLYDGRET